MGDRFDHTLEHRLETKAGAEAGGTAVRGIALITGTGRRRQGSQDDKARLVIESLRPGADVSEVARCNGLSPQQVFGWRRKARALMIEAGLSSDAPASRQRSCCSRAKPKVGALAPADPAPAFASVAIATPASAPPPSPAPPELSRIEIDSNTVERSIRPLALTRKNALFAGHDMGAASWAMHASLIETCKLNGVDPLAWMTDVLTKLVNRWPASKIDELMPWAHSKKPA
jgi:hypothetical protein